MEVKLKLSDKLWILGFALIFLLLTLFYSDKRSSIAIPDKHPLDKSETKILTLDNGLDVILVSNPKYNISAASMNVKVGSLSDPKEAQGLAHFLEHMLFLGTEKYPDVEDYKMYLSNNGGYSNAYTAEDHTNYLFEVIHDAYEGALDRFSQFFISPEFNPDFTKREINAVNSEFQKNLEHDYWRMRQIKRAIYDSLHPTNHFEIGSKETLEMVDREVLLDFHKKYYSANQMSLALLSKFSIKEMENWARKYFSAINNNNAKDIEYHPVYLSEKETLRLIRVKPVKDKKELALEFPIPLDLHKYYESKPDKILSSIIGHEGKGSLLSYLKNMGLATGLGAYGSPDTPNYGSFDIFIQLTDKGVEEYINVLDYCFSYFNMLKQTGFKRYLFEEQKTVSKLEEVYADKGEGAWKAISYANNLAAYPKRIAHRVDYFYGNPDPNAYMEILSYLRPDNLLCVLSADFTDLPLTEFWYQSEYGYEEVNNKRYQDFFNPKIIKEFHLPEPNQYLPEKASLLEVTEGALEKPYVIKDNKGLKLYYSQDIEFRRPKASYIYKIYFPPKFSDLASSTLMQLYVAGVNESMNEASYPARLAGMDFSITNDSEGIKILLSGYSDSIDELLLEVIDNMKRINIPAEQFNAMKAQMIRDWKNIDLGDAYRIARENMRKIQTKYYYTNSEYANIAEKIDFIEVKKFGLELIKSGYIQGLVHGNVSEEQAVHNTELFIENLNISPIAWEDVFVQRNLDIKSGEEITSVVKSKVNNSCLWQLNYFGHNSIEDDAYSMVVGKFIESPFYLEMRTRQQLGYIVWGGGSSRKKSSYFYFIIQSGDYSADYLMQQANELIVTLPDSLSQISDEEFQTIKAGVIEKIKEKPTSIVDKAQNYFVEAFDHGGSFNRDNLLINAIDNLSKEDAVGKLKKIFEKNTKQKATVLLYAKHHTIDKNISSSFNDINKWKNKRKYY